MDFDVMKFAQEQAQVQKKKKYQHFTVKEIGGPAEIGAWRAKNEAKMAAYEAQERAKDFRRTEFAASIGGVDSPKVIDMHKGDWMKKLAYAEKRRADYGKPELLPDADFSIYKPERDERPAISLWAAALAFVRKIWKSANF